MKIILHGKLRRLIGEEFEINTTIPADAIEGLSRQVDWPRDMLVDVLDFDSEIKLRAHTDVEEIHIAPAMAGGGGNIGRIIIGVVIIAAVVFSGGTWTPLALMALSIGVSLTLSGVMGMMYKAPSLHKSEDPPASKILGNNGNTVTIGTYRALAYGRTRVDGHWLSLQVDAKSIVMGRFPTTPPA